MRFDPYVAWTVFLVVVVSLLVFLVGYMIGQAL